MDAEGEFDLVCHIKECKGGFTVEVDVPNPEWKEGDKKYTITNEEVHVFTDREKMLQFVVVYFC